MILNLESPFIIIELYLPMPSKVRTDPSDLIEAYRHAYMLCME